MCVSVCVCACVRACVCVCVRACVCSNDVAVSQSWIGVRETVSLSNCVPV